VAPGDDRDPRLEFECSRTWDSLARTTDPDVRHCDSCRHLVHRVHSDADLADHARRGHCVSLLPSPYAWPRGANVTGRPAPPPPGADTSWLVVLTGPQKDRVIVLIGGSITIGRGPADIVLDDESLAPQQLRIVREGGVLRLYDLTLSGETGVELRDGDVITLGSARAVFKTVAGTADLPAPRW